MLGTTTKLSIPFQVLKEIFFLGIGLTVTEIKTVVSRSQTLMRKDGAQHNAVSVYEFHLQMTYLDCASELVRTCIMMHDGR